MKWFVFVAGVVLPLIVAGCLGDGPRMKEIELTEAQKRFKTNTTFEDGVFSFEFTPENGATRTLDTRLHQNYSTSYRLPPPVLPGFSSRAWQLTDNADDGRTFAYALVSWNRDDPADYLSAGWWLHLPPDVSFRNRNEAETGVFMDGPELDLSKPPDLPVEGQAVYLGTTGGVYRYQQSDGELEEYEYNAFINLAADFSNETISGCVGCIGDIETQRLYLYGILGWRWRPPAVPPTDYQVHIGATPFNTDGTFEGMDVAVTHAERNVTESSGSWAGQFSNVPDADGNPRLIVGLNDVTFEEGDGASGNFIGIFQALSPGNQPPPESETR
ncbi:MAG: hypothetical protein OXF11_02385 [Deltaproteobacteria bacterium]|nr:hypothetical protein [Deltaproteobacteria bacterium]